MSYNSEKIYISYNEKIEKIESPLIEMFKTDKNEGDNIADKSNYCELRTQYYVWKNECPEYVGMFQFRRFLNISKEVSAVNSTKKIKPYIISKSPVIDNNIEKKIKEFKENYDVIAPIPEYTGVSVYERYALSKGHRKEDLDLVIDILNEKYPEFKKAIDIYLNGKEEYYGSMFFMNKETYQRYCSWLFDILFTFDEKSNDILPKTNGYLGERLFGIYFTYLKIEGKLSLGELPRCHYYCYDDEGHNFKQQKIINILIPPGSKIRGVIRKLLYLWR